MKLFQQLLVAGASLGLLAPFAAQASDVVNIEEINRYTRSTKKKSSRIDSNTFINSVSEDIAKQGVVDGLEDQQNILEAGAFSSTTSMDGKAVFFVGGAEGVDEFGGTENIQTGYTYTMNLNTSFNGDDNLYVRLKAGNQGPQWKEKQTYHIETKGTSNAFNVDKIWYSFKVGDSITAFAGPLIENYYMYVTPSIYKPGALKSFKLGGNSNFGASTDVGWGFKYEADNGFAVASNIVSKNADSDKGMLGKTDINKWDTQIAYTADRWHVSATLSDAQNWTSQSYNATSKAANMGTSGDTTGYALRAYWMPEETGTSIPEISVGYDTKLLDNATGSGTAKEADSYFVGLTWKDMFQADDRIGVAVTRPLAVTAVVGGGATGEVNPLVWEAYYAFRPNDSMELRPAVFGGSEVNSDYADNMLGAVLTTTFKF